MFDDIFAGITRSVREMGPSQAVSAMELVILLLQGLTARRVVDGKETERIALLATDMLIYTVGLFSQTDMSIGDVMKAVKEHPHQRGLTDSQRGENPVENVIPFPR
jgi:hypothetical protein